MKKYFTALSGKKMVIGASLLLMAVAPIAQAAEFMAPNKEDDGRVILTSTESRRNLYIAGGDVTINGEVKGDLYAAGGMVSVDGPVEQDANIAGGNLSLNGSVGGDVRIGGGNVTINSKVGGDVLVGGGNIKLTEKASVAGDLIVGGGNITIESPVAGSIRAASDTVFINSPVGGTVWVQSGTKVTFGEKALVPGKIIVASKNDPIVKDGAAISSIERKAWPEHRSGGAAGFITVFTIVNLLAYFIVAWVLLRLFGSRMPALVHRLQSKTWSHLGWGIAGMVLIPIIAIVLFITFIGYYLAILVLLSYFLLLALSCIVASLWLGSWIMQKVQKKADVVLDWKTAAVGVLAFTILELIPFVGWIFCSILVVASFGGIMMSLKSRFDTKE